MTLQQLKYADAVAACGSISEAARAAEIAAAFKDLGFAYVTLDLQGYRTGSLNETLERNGSWASA